jgi:hypothetical protein
MKKSKRNMLIEGFQRYRFEFRHIIVLFMILLLFQMIISYVHRLSLKNFLVKTQDWYQQDSAERLANLSATSLELLLETTLQNRKLIENEQKKIVEALNIILSQQILQPNVQEICILISNNSVTNPIYDGKICIRFSLVA